VALPVISREFNADAILLNWVSTAHQLTVVVFMLPFGRIADIVGIKKIIVTGMIIYTATSVLCAFSNSMITLIIFRSLQGIGGAMIFGNFTGMLTAIYPARDRGRVLGINIAIINIGMFLGPYLGGVMTEHLGWRSLFLANIPAGVLVIILILWKIKGDSSESKGEKFDTSGSVIYGAAIVAMIFGFSQLPEISGVVLTLAGIMGLLFFLMWESRNKSPILNINLFRNNKALLFANIATLISYCATTAVAFLLSLYLQYIKALTPDQAGLVLLAQPALQAIFSPFTGRLSDRIEPRILASAGMLLTFVALLFFSFLTNNTSIISIVIILAVLGIGLGVFVPPNTNAVMSSATPKFYGTVASINGTMRNIGMLMSMAITMIAMATIIGRVTITPEYYSEFLTSTRVAFTIFSVFCFVGIFASLYRGKITQRTDISQ
jgi:EmrB/QacA subfamily drug resistance transporter